jgi:IS30 family transposase
MPVAKRLDCAQAVQAVQAFLDGASVKYIAAHFNVTRLTITRLLKRETYKDCKQLDSLTGGDYLETLKERMRENSHRGRGQKVEVQIA